MVAALGADRAEGSAELTAEGRTVICPPQVVRQSSLLSSLVECSADPAPIPIPFTYAAVEAFCSRMPKSAPGSCALHQLEVVQVLRLLSICSASENIWVLTSRPASTLSNAVDAAECGCVVLRCLDRVCFRSTAQQVRH